MLARLKADEERGSAAWAEVGPLEQRWGRGREVRNSGHRPTSGCVSNPTPPATLRRRQEGEAGQDASLRLFWPSLYLTMLVSTFYSHTNQIFHRVDAEQSLSGLPGGTGSSSLASNGCFPVKQAQVRPGRHG